MADTWPMRWSLALGAVGRFLIGLAVVMLLFASYQLWGTGIQEARAQNALADEFDELLAAADTVDTNVVAPEAVPPPDDPDQTPGTTAPPQPDPTFDPELAQLFFPDGGDPVARMTIPAIGVDKVVVEGVQVEDLRQGPGHYTSTPMPGQPGNAAVAGHRTTYGAPFHSIDELAPGDEIQVQTFQGTFTYRVLPQPVQSWDGGFCAARERELAEGNQNALDAAAGNMAQTLPDDFAVGAIDGMTFFDQPLTIDDGIDETIFDSDAPGNFIVSPTERCVLDDFGDNRITLTACHPKYSSRQRIIVQALLVSAPAAPPSVPRPQTADEGLGADETPPTSAPSVSTAPDDDDPAAVAFGDAEPPPPSDTELDLNDGLGWNWEFLSPALFWSVLCLAVYVLAKVGAARWRTIPSYALAVLPLAVTMFLAFEQIDKILPAI